MIQAYRIVIDGSPFPRLAEDTEGDVCLRADHIAAMAEAVRIIEQCLKIIQDEREVLERSFLPEPSETEAELLTAYEEATVAAKAFMEAHK